VGSKEGDKLLPKYSPAKTLIKPIKIIKNMNFKFVIFVPLKVSRKIHWRF